MSQIPDTADLMKAADLTAARMEQAQAALAQRVFGQDAVIEQSLTTLLAGGHALLTGAPGLAKTRLVQCLAVVLGLQDKRVQFTPDLMPSDIIGSEILDQTDDGRRSFRFVAGPVFAQLLMADEINRAGPRTQSALLQAMQEGRVSVAGHYHDLPRPFHVLATQNPLEQEGTYPLPEAQLDRFLMQITVPYPDWAAERQMLIVTTGRDDAELPVLFNGQDLQKAQQIVRVLPVGEAEIDRVLTLVRSGRPDQTSLANVRRHVAWGPGPRATQALLLSAKARALIQGRLSPSRDDLMALAHPVLGHRIILTYAAQADGITVTDVVNQMVDAVA